MDIVERIAREIAKAEYEWDSSPKAMSLASFVAPFAIRATLEHYAENVSNSLGVAGGLKLENIMFEGGEEGTGVIFHDVKPVFKAMLSQALAELDP